MIRSDKRESFTLVELVIVVSIIVVLVSIAILAINKMWQQAQIQNVNLRLTRMIHVAREQSKSFNLPMKAYGLFFYIDPQTNNQAVSFIKTKGVPGVTESYPDVISRFEIDQQAANHTFRFKSFLGVSPISILDWENEEVINDDYANGRHRNFFAVVFSNGNIWTLTDSIFIYDEDKNEDGIGDKMGFKIKNLLGDFGELNNVMYNDNEELLKFSVTNGILVYDSNAFDDYPESLRLSFLKNQFDHMIKINQITSPLILYRK